MISLITDTKDNTRKHDAVCTITQRLMSKRTFYEIKPTDLVLMPVIKASFLI